MDKEPGPTDEGGEDGDEDGNGSKKNNNSMNIRAAPLVGVAPTMDFHEVFTGAPGCPDKAVAASSQRNRYLPYCTLPYAYIHSSLHIHTP